jgi:hypothetical protein
MKILLAGQEGLEPPTSGFGVRRSTIRATGLHADYLVSLWGVCPLQKGQYLLNSSLLGVFFLFFVVV